MGFKRPTLNELEALAEQLSKEYKGTNPQRLSFIALLQELIYSLETETDTNKKIDILLGAIVFELEMIESKYTFLSPDRSDMHALIKKKINLSTENPMSLDERLIYLHKFHQYSQTALTDENIKRVSEEVLKCEWKTKESLLKNIHHGLHEARKKDTSYINALVNGTPNLIAIQKKMQTVTENYHAQRAKKRWAMFQSSKRAPTCEVSDFIHDTCLDFFATNYDGKSTPGKSTEQLQELECKTRLGLSLAMLMDIYGEYWVLSPKGGWFNNGSELYKLLLPMMNIQDIDKISYDDKNDWLLSLKNHITNVKSDEKYYQAMIKKYQDEGVKDIDKLFTQFETRVNKLYAALQDEKNTPSRGVRLTTTVVSYTTQSVAARLMADTAESATKYVLTGAGSIIGGPIVGLAVYLGTTVIMTGLRALLKKDILTGTAAMLYAWLLEKIGDTVANAAVGVVAYPFSTSKEGLTSLRRKLSAENDKLFCDWVNTLLELPNDIVAVKEKEQIRDVLGLEAEEKLIPLPVKVKNPQKEEQLAKEGFFSRVRRKNVNVVQEDYQPQAKMIKV